MQSPFIAHIRNYVQLSESEINTISQYTRSKSIRKKEYLHKEGEICTDNYFIEKGCLRMFFINEKGIEQITQFAIENWWLSDYMSFGRQIPSHFSIQAIENTNLISINHHSQEELLNQIPSLERYFRLMLQHAYAAAQQRLKYLHDFSKEESYRHFMSRFPGFAQRLPQYMLASYLGLTPEYLSEIRRKAI